MCEGGMRQRGNTIRDAIVGRTQKAPGGGGSSRILSRCSAYCFHPFELRQLGLSLNRLVPFVMPLACSGPLLR